MQYIYSIYIFIYISVSYTEYTVNRIFYTSDYVCVSVGVCERVCWQKKKDEALNFFSEKSLQKQKKIIIYFT